MVAHRRNMPHDAYIELDGGDAGVHASDDLFGDSMTRSSGIASDCMYTVHTRLVQHARYQVHSRAVGRRVSDACCRGRRKVLKIVPTLATLAVIWHDEYMRTG